MRHTHFDAVDPSSSPPFVELFFFLFKSHIASEFIFNKNEKKNQKVENNVSGRVRVGVERALLSR